MSETCEMCGRRIPDGGRYSSPQGIWRINGLLVCTRCDAELDSRGAELNPEWVAAGPESNVHFVVNADGVKLCPGTVPARWKPGVKRLSRQEYIDWLKTEKD